MRSIRIINFLKENKIYILVGLCMVFINVFVFWFSKPFVTQEIFYYPWLTSKGFLIYRDFFQNHGPLLYYLFAPLMLDKSLTLIKILYILVQSANLALILMIIKKFVKLPGFIIGGITFLVINFYYSYPYFWDEQIIATLYLVIYYLITLKESAKKSATIGILIGLASLIKPNTLIIAIPVLLFYKRKSFLLYPVLIWLIVVVYFYLSGSLFQLLDNYFIYNFYYQSYYSRYFPYLSAIKSNWFFLNFLIVLTVIAFHSLNKKSINIRLFVFLLITSLYFYPVVGSDRFAPFTSFLAIFVAYLSANNNKKLTFFTIVVLYLALFSYKAKNKIQEIQINPSPIENARSQKIVGYLKKENLVSKNFYVMSNNTEIYYLLDKPSKIYFPLMYPSISSYYKEYQEIYIRNIKMNETDVVVIPLPIDSNYSSAKSLVAFIKISFSLYHKDSDFLVYTKKK